MVCHLFSDTHVQSHTSWAFIYCNLPLSIQTTYIHAAPQQHLDTTLTKRNTTTEKHNPQETQPL
jgi:hypothetical protein